MSTVEFPGYYLPDVSDIPMADRQRAALDRVARGLTVLGEERGPIVASLIHQRDAAAEALKRATSERARDAFRKEVAWCSGQIEMQRREIDAAERRT